MAQIRTGAAKLGGTEAAGKNRGSADAKRDGNLRVHARQLYAEKPMAELRTASAGTPLEPLAAKLAAAVEKAGRENDADAQFVLSQTGGKGRLEVGSLTLRSDSGAKADLASGSRLGFSWPGGSLTLNGSMRLAGGDRKSTRLNSSH